MKKHVIVSSLRFNEKGDKDREIPVRHNLEAWINEYIAAADSKDSSKTSPLFRAADGKRKSLMLKGISWSEFRFRDFVDAVDQTRKLAGKRKAKVAERGINE